MDAYGQLHASATLYMRKETSKPTDQKVVQVPDTVWLLSRRDKFLALAGDETEVPQITSPKPSL